MRNLSGRVSGKMYVSEQIIFPSLVISNLDLTPNADDHFLFYANAPAFIFPEPSYRLQHMEVSYSILHFFSSVFSLRSEHPFRVTVSAHVRHQSSLTYFGTSLQRL